MCSDEVLAFGEAQLGRADVAGKDVLEVGARIVQDLSLTLRHHVTSLGPASYVGVDVEEGPGVDEICDAKDLVPRFGEQSFDLVVATEVLEHVDHWAPVVASLKQVLRDGGVLLVTTRSEGFPYHAWPHDHWRFGLDDFRRIFADMDIVALERDPKEPGVFMKAVRPIGFTCSSPRLEIYEVTQGRRVWRRNRARERVFTAVMAARYSWQRRVPETVRRRINRLLGRRRG